MLSGGNLAQFWQDYAQGAESNPLTPIPPVNITAGLQATLGLDLEQDLLPWMGGEFSIALIPASLKCFSASGKPAVYPVRRRCSIHDPGKRSQARGKIPQAARRSDGDSLSVHRRGN
jgi:hypothetical protein